MKPKKFNSNKKLNDDERRYFLSGLFFWILSFLTTIKFEKANTSISLSNNREGINKQLANKTTHYLTMDDFVTGAAPIFWDNVLQAILEKVANEKVAYTIMLKPQTYKFQNTINITNCYGIRFVGSNPLNTIFRFVNNAVDKPFILLDNMSSGTVFENIHFYDDTNHTSKGVKLTFSTAFPGVNYPNAYNNFKYCIFNKFKTAVNFTSGQPLVGATHACLDSTNFEHCKFWNNKLTFLNQNKQAVNINLLASDVENTDIGEQYTLIRDEAGSHFNIFGGSWIGQGKVIDFYRNKKGTNLFNSCRYSFSKTRFELRSNHIGTLVECLVDRKTSYSVNFAAKVDFVDCIFYKQASSITLNKTMRIAFSINNCDVYTGDITVYDYPTAGLEGEARFGSSTMINIQNSKGFLFLESQTSPFGKWSKRNSSITKIENNSGNDTNVLNTVDSDGFYSLNSSMFKYNHMGFGLNMVSAGKIIFNDNATLGGTTLINVKFKLPYNARPIKAFCYKHPIRLAENFVFQVYIVKDKSYWTNPSSFNVSTDGILVATMDTTGKAGYFESVVQITTNDMGDYLKVGETQNATWTWQEGRIYFATSGYTHNFAGFLGMEYI